ncbi:unnamed protein product [Arctogadus glacialis]
MTVLFPRQQQYQQGRGDFTVALIWNQFPLFTVPPETSSKRGKLPSRLRRYFCRRRGNKLSQSRLSSWGHRCLETPGRSQGLKAGRDIQGLGVESVSHNSHKQKDPGETGGPGGLFYIP